MAQIGEVEEAQLKISLHTPTVHEKWSKNHDDLVHPGRVIIPQSVEKVLSKKLFFNFTLQ